LRLLIRLWLFALACYYYYAGVLFCLINQLVTINHAAADIRQTVEVEDVMFYCGSILLSLELIWLLSRTALSSEWYILSFLCTLPILLQHDGEKLHSHDGVCLINCRVIIIIIILLLLNFQLLPNW